MASQPTSGFDISRFNDFIPIIPYPTLSNYRSIESLLKLHPSRAFALIYLTAPKLGHWILVNESRQYPNTIEIFDPYGYPIDYYINTKENKKPIHYRQGSQYPDSMVLSKLLARYDGDVIRNKRKLQSTDPNVRTCGKWVTLRYNMLGISLAKFIKMFLHTPDRDKVVALIVDTLNKKDMDQGVIARVNRLPWKTMTKMN